MFKFLFVIFFFFVLLLFLMGFSVFRMIGRIFFGNNDHQRRTHSGPSSGQKPSDPSHTQQEKTGRKKIIDKNEGEYVDYEEVS